MNEIYDTLEAWLADGEDLAVATVVNVDGSAPRAEGAKMLVGSGGRIAGSVSGGCVESAVAQEALEVLRARRPKLARYGINRNMMWDVGLSCGGAIDVLIEPVEPHRWRSFIARVREGGRLAMCTIVTSRRRAGNDRADGSEHIGAKILVDAAGSMEASTGDRDVDARIAAAALPLIRRGLPQLLDVGEDQVFVDVVTPPDRLIVVGAVHVAAALCDMAAKGGYSVIVIDPRPALNNRERFPLAEELRVGWPEDELGTLRIDENTYVAVLTHDEKFDDPTLRHCLRTPAKYVGAIGSKKTHALRRARLIEDGFSQEDVDRICAPIGLDIGAESPNEIAVAILSEMIATKYGHRGASLKEREAAHIH